MQQSVPPPVCKYICRSIHTTGKSRKVPAGLAGGGGTKGALAHLFLPTSSHELLRPAKIHLSCEDENRTVCKGDTAGVFKATKFLPGGKGSLSQSYTARRTSSTISTSPEKD